MLRICEKLRQVDEKSERFGLVRTEPDYLRALLDSMADMDGLMEVEVLKSLGDVNVERGQLDNNPEMFDRAMVLYRTALLRCEDANVGESLENRYLYAEKLRLGKVTVRTASVSYEPLAKDKEIPSLAKVAEKLQPLDSISCKKDLILTQYTKFLVEGIVNGDNLLESEAIKSLGDVYLERGTETRDTACMTKASALYNTALARCGESQGKVALVHRLLHTAKIRQETENIRKQGLRLREKRQLQQHLFRHFPMTSGKTMPGFSGHQFLSPREYIASQTTKHATPDYRAYRQHLTTGDRALAVGKLDLAERGFTSALKLIHDRNKPDRWKEAECLRRLGDVYVQRGKTTKEGRKFTQAAALYNAAMARSSADGKEQKLTESLRETERSFLQFTANVQVEPSSYDTVIHHKKILENMRSRAESQLEAIDQQHNPYQYGEDDPDMILVEIERAEAVKELFKTIAKDRQVFVKDLVDECIDTLGVPPCKYAFIGLGSQATELVTPYSDLEFAILIEEGKDITRQYFLNLTHYLNLKVINLGETILPAMAIPSLNDFQSEDPGKDWFYDSVTPRGFAFDGFMPWACKTPFGRDKTKTKPSVSLIQTPSKMAEFQQVEIALAEGYHLSDILRRFVFLTGTESLGNEYMAKLSEIITGDLRSRSRSRLSAIQVLWDNKDQVFTAGEPTGQLINVKKDMYRYPGIAVDILALCCQTTHASTWSIIDELRQTRRIHEENASHLTVLTSISAELRLRTYIANGGQKDSLSPLSETTYQSAAGAVVSDTTLKSVFHIQDTKVLFRYYCRAIPLKKSIPDAVIDSLNPHRQKILESNILDISNQCRGRIARNLLLSAESMRLWDAALQETDSDDVERSKILYELGLSCEMHGDATKAIRHYEESLRISRTIHGDNTAHPDIAASLNSLGTSWSKLGDEKKAISYLEQSITMMSTIYGDKTPHPNIAGSFLNIGVSWSKLGDHKKAICYFQQSLQQWTTIYGDNATHPDIATRLGDQRKAISFFEESLSIAKTVYGDNTEHPDIASSFLHLGSSWGELGDHKKAIRYLEQSLAMRKTIVGSETAHPDIAKALQNLGTSWNKLGDQKKAIGYFEQSLKLVTIVYGDHYAHPDMAMTLNNLGSSWSKLGNQRRAISCYERSLKIGTTLYGNNTAHPDTAASLNNLGSCWGKLGDQRKAISYFEQSLSMRQIFYGNNVAHPDIAVTLNNLGTSWSCLGDQRKAISYLEQSLAIKKSIFGQNMPHPAIAASLHNLGSCWGKLGDHRRAISYFQQSLEMRKTVYGNNMAHPEIAMLLQNLRFAWNALNKEREATK
ncbi:hypothetical protein Bbelb_176350 [Branchiostoma belcheri]|nr:hypothetical protein Bbelb_176350 [Branchiostoma belcheri]